MAAVGKKKSWLKVLIFIFFQLLMVFILLEILLSVIYFQKYGNDSLASIQLYKKIKNKFKSDNTYDIRNQQTVRPGSSLKINAKIAAEVKESNIEVYEPWLQFKTADFKGQYVNIEGALRKTAPDASYTASADTVSIYFFGGSTLFGFNVADGETIPSQFVKLYKEKFAHGKSIKVFNYGMPFYYSYQELMLLSNLLFTGYKPGLVIFLDGLNDFRFVKASYYRQPFFSYILRQVFDKEYLKANKFHFKDTSEAMIEDPRGIRSEDVSATLVQYYFQNISNIQKMADAYNVKAFYFCQPVPFYNYPGQDKDLFCDKDKNTKFNQAYPLVEKQGAAIKNFFFIGNMLQGETGHPFVDGFHYSPDMNRKIAGAILGAVKKELE